LGEGAGSTRDRDPERALSTNEAAAHSAVINAERELVTMHFTLLLGRELPRRRVSDNGSIPSGKTPPDGR
jgi:hypothetical protein